MADTHAATILQILQDTAAVPKLVKPKNDPFETLVITIISQNTADRNTERAFENLSKQFEVTPQALSKAETSKIEACLHVGGLYKSKAKTIQTVSKIILEKFQGSLKPILSLPLEEARKTLMELPGVGPENSGCCLALRSKSTHHSCGHTCKSGIETAWVSACKRRLRRGAFESSVTF